MTQVYAFNGDADGLCALQQLRLADGGAIAGGDAGAGGPALVTGVKRDIALLDRVKAAPGDRCTVLDVSLDVNRAGLLALLDAGVAVRYFDHHFAGEVPRHPLLEAHLDPSPSVCTSLIVDIHLNGMARRWAIVGSFGDSLVEEGRALARAAGLGAEATQRLQQLGLAVNYNAYGETIADLHVPPAQLAAEMHGHADPLQFAESSSSCQRLFEGFRRDMELARELAPVRQVAGAIVFVLPDAAWARRASGTLANDLAKAHAGSAVAILSPKVGGSDDGGGYLVSVRVPRDAAVTAESFCRRFPTGGGRSTAAGINHLPSERLTNFTDEFERQFRLG